jgi:predicted DNA-binding transcriptional regulator AlpA
MAERYVDEVDMRRSVRSAVRRALVDAGLDEGEAADLVVTGVARRIADWLRTQRTAPRLIGATASAKLLGVQPPHLARLRAQGRMPDPIPVEGSADVYIREEVEALAKKLEAERRARAERRREREAV